MMVHTTLGSPETTSAGPPCTTWHTLFSIKWKPKGRCLVNAIKATWTHGQIVLSQPVDWPEGSELLVEPVATSEIIGLDESQWQDSPEALADWESWIRTIEPPEYTDEERSELARYREEFRRYNLEAVRKQMGLGDAQ